MFKDTSMVMAKSYVKALCISALFFLAAGATVDAAETGAAHPYLTEKFFLDLGIYFPERTLRISVDGPGAPQNREIDFGDSLRLSSGDETALLNFGWHVSEHWRLSAQYFRSADAVGAVLEEEIE